MSSGEKIITPATKASGSSASIKKMVANVVAASAKNAQTGASGTAKAAGKKAPAQRKASKPIARPTSKTVKTTTQSSKENAMKEKMEKLTGDAFVKADELTKLVQENTDAYLKFVTSYAKGLEEVRKQCFDYSRAAFEKGTEASKELLTCKTLGEFTEKQSKFTQNAFNDFVAESTKISEKALKVATDASAPLKERIEATVETVSKKMAA